MRLDIPTKTVSNFRKNYVAPAVTKDDLPDSCNPNFVSLKKYY